MFDDDIERLMRIRRRKALDRLTTSLLVDSAISEIGATDDATDAKIIFYLRGTPYRVLLEEGHPPQRVAECLRDGLVSIEGIRQVFAGAPVEWVRAFEQGGASR